MRKSETDQTAAGERAALNLLVVEDNYDDMEYVCDSLKELDTGLNIYKAGKAFKALEMIHESQIDLVLLDVELPDMNGFSLANRIRNMEEGSLLPIVFITGTDANPLMAHRKYHCYDYIKKPFMRSTFNQVMKPLLKGLVRQKNRNSRPALEKEKVVFLETKEDIFIVKYDDILFAEISGRTITVYLADRTISGVKMKFDAFIETVDSPDFLRCHKSYAVNIRKVDQIKKIDYRSWEILFKDIKQTDSTKCMLSKTYKDSVFAAINDRKDDEG
ncbi:LytR/AlgR family response regulator transcription factor [Hominibacterium faecale]|uniref:LytR/AlgR family response regulator transcription factor n=1 Tax=Hominibacterium faecale TaxID=2839743 RepID=UPI0022B298F3|nr:response regulator [Hominibacterium faecale]